MGKVLNSTKIILFFTFCLNFIACNKEIESEEQPIIIPEIIINDEILTNGIVFTSDGGKNTIEFTVNTDWTLNIAPTENGIIWCTPSMTKGEKGKQTVEFTTTKNNNYDDRSVAVTIQAGEITKTFTIFQKQKNAILLSGYKFECNSEEGNIAIEIKSNVNYKLRVSDKDKEWIKEIQTRALNSQIHSFNISANENYDKREGTIYVESDELTEIVHVYQAGNAVLLLTKNEYFVSDKGGIISVDIKSNFSFDVQMPDVDWITNDVATYGTSSHTLKYIIAPNNSLDERTAQIIYFDKNSELKDTLTIIQNQKDAILVTPKEYKFSWEGGFFDAEITSNVNYQIEIDENCKDWIKQTSTNKAIDNRIITFEILQNHSSEQREGIILFKNDKIQQAINVMQESGVKATSLEITPAGASFYIGKYYDFSVKTVPENAAIDCEWNILDSNIAEFTKTGNNPLLYTKDFGVTEIRVKDKISGLSATREISTVVTDFKWPETDDTYLGSPLSMLGINETQKLKCSYSPSYATNVFADKEDVLFYVIKNNTWVIDMNQDIISLSDNGMVTGLKDGMVGLKVTGRIVRAEGQNRYYIKVVSALDESEYNDSFSYANEFSIPIRFHLANSNDVDVFKTKVDTPPMSRFHFKVKYEGTFHNAANKVLHYEVYDNGKRLMASGTPSFTEEKREFTTSTFLVSGNTAYFTFYFPTDHHIGLKPEGDFILSVEHN